MNLIKDDKSFKNACIAFIVCIILFSLMFFNSSEEKSYRFDLSDTTSTSQQKEWSPRLSLPKGTYSLSFSSSGSGTLYLTEGDGTVLTQTDSASSTTLNLSHDVTELVVRADQNSNIKPTNITVTSTSRIYTDAYLIYILFVLAAFACILCKFLLPDGKKETAAIYLALAAIGIFATYPYFTNYLQYADDITFHLARIEGIKDGLIRGQFPVRLDPMSGNGYGYPTGFFYGNLFLYFPAILRILGVSAITAYKTLCLSINIATAFIAYYSAKSITKSRYTGFIFSVIYTLATWRLICVISRSALGEGLSMMVLPLIIAGLYHIIIGNKNKWYVLAIGFTLLIQSHIINTLIGGILALVIVLCFIPSLLKENRLIALLKAAILTVLLNMWFIIPFITAYTNVDMNIHHSLSAGNFRAGAIIPAELFNIFNNKLGISQILSEGVSADMSLSIGIIPSIGLVVGLMYTLFAKKKLENHKLIVILFLFSAVALYMSTSLFPWDYLRDHYKFIHFFENTLQFPWRFLTIATLAISFAFALIIGGFKKPKQYSALIAITLVSALGFVMFAQVFTTEKGIWTKKGQAVTDSVSLGATGEYLPNGKKYDDLKAQKYTVSGVKLSSYEKNGTTVKLTLSDAKSNSYVDLPLLWYPGYTASDNSHKLKVTKNIDGNVRVMLENGSDNVTVKYSGTPAFKIGDIITLLTLIAAAALYIAKRKHIKLPALLSKI